MHDALREWLGGTERGLGIITPRCQRGQGDPADSVVVPDVVRVRRYGSGVRDENTVGAGLRALVSSQTRLVLVVVTALVGAVAAFGLAAVLVPEGRTLTGIVPLTQLIISVFTPFVTALLTHELRDAAGGGPAQLIAAVRSRWIAAGIYGVVMGGYGALAAGVATTAAASSGGVPTTVDLWAGAGPAVLGSLLVQLIPVGVGCAAGLLIPRRGHAVLATVVVPLLASFVLPRLTPAGTTDWVTPLAAADHLLPGPMTAVAWAQWIVTAALWVVLPNWLGARRLRRRAVTA